MTDLGQTDAAPGAKGYWGRNHKNARVWVDASNSANTISVYAEGRERPEDQSQKGGAQEADEKQMEQWRSTRPFVLCYQTCSPRSESMMSARSRTSQTSSIAFSNDARAGMPRVGSQHIYSKIGSINFKARAIEPAENCYERTLPPAIPNTSTSQGLAVFFMKKAASTLSSLSSCNPCPGYLSLLVLSV